MNPIYLLEPYNAYQQPAKKKHWMEIAEEEALYHRMAQDAMLREAMSAQMTQLDSVQDGHSSCATIASPAGGAGAGGVPTWDFFQSSVELAGFTFSPASPGGPISLSFTNLTRTPDDDTFYWTFGDGTTSTAINPIHVYPTGSFNIYMESTSSTGFTSFATSNVTVSAPVITSGFTRTPDTGSAPFTASFTNTTTQNGSGPLTYNWVFGDGATSTLANPTHVYATGSFKITLSVTSSTYPTITASNTPFFNITGTVPVITPNFNANITTGTAPLNVTFSNATTISNGLTGTLTYKWELGSGSYTSTITNATMSYATAGTYTVKLAVTESNYAQMTSKTSASYIIVS